MLEFIKGLRDFVYPPVLYNHDYTKINIWNISSSDRNEERRDGRIQS